MNHDEIRDLLPGYALGVLDAEEVTGLEAHLRDCREHDEELVELRATVLALGTLVEEQQPSPALTSEIERIAGTPGGAGAARAGDGDARQAASAAGATEAAPGHRPAGIGRAGWWLRAAAAAALVALVFAAGWLAGAGIGAEDRYTYRVQSTDGVTLEFSGVAGADSVTVWMAGLERLPSDRRYQLWAIRDDRWLSIGVCNTNASGRWLGDFPFAFAPEEEIALTIEPAAGSERPTGEPLLRTRF